MQQNDYDDDDVVVVVVDQQNSLSINQVAFLSFCLFQPIKKNIKLLYKTNTKIELLTKSNVYL